MALLEALMPGLHHEEKYIDNGDFKIEANDAIAIHQP